MIAWRELWRWPRSASAKTSGAAARRLTTRLRLKGLLSMKGDSRVDPRDLHIPPALLAAAPKEVAFVCGRAGASQAINEEEDDDGLEEARELLRKRGATSKRARTDADEPPPPRGHQDSPRTQQ